MAGLIHDIGIIVELQTCGRAFATAFSHFVEGRYDTLCEAEMDAIGATHEDFGGTLCCMWNFPPSLEAVARFHHRPNHAPAEHQVLTAIVYLADVMSSAIDNGASEHPDGLGVDMDMIASLHLSQTDLKSLEKSVAEKMLEINDLFGAIA